MPSRAPQEGAAVKDGVVKDGVVEDGVAGGSASDGARLTSREAADLLGVKIETVYAYVSRGLLHSRRGAGGRGSTFDPAEVEQLRLVGRARPRAVAGPVDLAVQEAGAVSASRVAVPGSGVRVVHGVGRVPGLDRDGSSVTAGRALGGGASIPVLRTRITAIRDGALYYRGRDAVDLVADHRFEWVASWLWQGRDVPVVPFVVPSELAATLRRASALLPGHARLTDRLRVAVSVAAADDPLRFDLREDAVLLTGRTLIAALVEALPHSGQGRRVTPSGPGPDGGEASSISVRLWDRLASGLPEPVEVECLDQALGLLADHDLAVSTFAARVAASARADPYAVVSAGLAALDGPLHGGASRLAFRLLREVLERRDAVEVLSERLRSGQPIPGFGHGLYPDGDPRARALLAALSDVPRAGRYLDVAAEVAGAAGRGHALRPNVDLALAVLALSAGMPAEAGEVIFAVARTAGWIAHALEEYQEQPLRLRPQGSYAGPLPATEL